MTNLEGEAVMENVERSDYPDDLRGGYDYWRARAEHAETTAQRWQAERNSVRQQLEGAVSREDALLAIKMALAQGDPEGTNWSADAEYILREVTGK